MTELSKERRAKLERKLKSGNSVPVKDVRIDSDELRALLDLADERDLYRVLLEEVRRLPEKWRNNYPLEAAATKLHYNWGWNDAADEIEQTAALEGKNND